MRRPLLLVLTVLLAVPLAFAWRAPRDGRCRTATAARAARPCQQDGNAHREPASVEDGELKRHLEQQGARLIESGRTVSARVLVEQLQRRRWKLDLPEASSAERDSAELFLAAKPSVVVVSALHRCRRCVQWHATTASGFAIATEGTVVTNYHVMDDPAMHTFVVMTSDRRVLPVEQVLAASRADDLAILQVPADDLIPLPLARPAAPAPVGSPVTVISHPDGQFFCCTAGIVSRHFQMRVDNELIDAMGITADYARGSSGAPVLNSRGEVAGIVQSTESIYYSENAHQQRDLQMVFKTCIPVSSLRRLIGQPQPPAEAAVPARASPPLDARAARP